MKQLVLPLSFTALFTASVPPALAQCQSWELGTSDAVFGDTFGAAVAVANGEVLASMVLDDECSYIPGRFYAFERTADARYVQRQDVRPGDSGGLGDLFGLAMASYRDRVFVANDNNSAYFFRREAQGWVEQQQVFSSPLQSFVSVDIHDKTAVGGSLHAPREVFVFEEIGGTWQQTAVFEEGDSAGAGYFGRSVAVDGDLILVGAPRSDTDVLDSGAAYLFARQGGVWTQVQRLEASDRATGDEFGYSVGLAGGLAVVGARFRGLGEVYVFEESGASWVETGKIAPHDIASGARFGESVDLTWSPSDGPTIAIGAPWDDRGSAHVYRRPGGSWQRIARFDLPPGAARGGADIAIEGSVVVLGTPRRTCQPANTVFAFELDPCECAVGQPYCPAVPNSSGLAGRMTVVGSRTVDEDCLHLAATQLPSDSNIGYFVMGTGNAVFVPPGSAGPLCVSPGLQRFLPPVSNTLELEGGFQLTVGTSGPVSGNITAGSTWNFQAWHRDAVAGASNFTDAVSVTFL